jgi:hypothetical protein
VALRNANTGVFVLAGTRSTDSAEPNNVWQPVTFTQAQLAALDQNASYTLDLLDARAGGWGWINLDSVSIPGTLTATQPPALTIEIQTGNQVRVSWPAAAAGFSLQRSATAHGGYTSPGLTVATEGDDFVVYDTLENGARFYRLNK